MVRKVLIACDDSAHSRVAVDGAFQNVIHKSTDEVHLLTVLPPLGLTSAYPMAPVASAAAVTAVQHSLAAQKHADEEKAAETLRLATELVALDYKVPRANVHTHMVPATGGASGVSESIVTFARKQQVGMIVVGSRGMGSIKRSLMSLVGLGSVSDAVLHSAPCPVVLIREGTATHTGATEASPQPERVPKKVAVAVDDSPVAAAALSWALENVLGPHDHLHVLSVALPTPFAVTDEPGAVAALESRAHDASEQQAKEYAARVAERACESAVSRGVTRTKIVHAVLNPAGGTSDVGGAIAAYAQEKGLDVVVVGSRGMGALRRSLLGLVGLGSVSEYLAHHASCTLVVVPSPEVEAGAEEAGEAEEQGEEGQRRGSGSGSGSERGLRPRMSESMAARQGDNVSFQVIQEAEREGENSPAVTRTPSDLQNTATAE